MDCSPSITELASSRSSFASSGHCPLFHWVCLTFVDVLHLFGKADGGVSDMDDEEEGEAGEMDVEFMRPWSLGALVFQEGISGN